MIARLFLILALIGLISACGGGGGGGSGTPDPGPTDPPPAHIPIVLEPDTAPDPVLPAADDADAQEAARFLTQATFGPTTKEIVRLMDMTLEDWIDEQMTLPQTRQLTFLDDRIREIGFDPFNEEDFDEFYPKELQRSDVWWETVLFGRDQLRQRVAFALSEIFVISTLSDTLFNDSRGVANYHDMLAEHAFGNFRELLEAVTLNPMMGEYLSMVRNEKADAVRNIRPDENYARELMQLFSIGLIELNNDGTPRLDQESNTIPTYDQEIIKAFARVFTGWMYGDAPTWYWFDEGAASEVLPMKAFADFHDNGEKTLLNNQVLPAGQTPEQDLAGALDNIFNHPNVGPFIGKQLIQRLVTSNPSSDYVARVASVFNDNGSGERGDMAAVIRAILLDTEARHGHTEQSDTFGKLKEPLLKLTALWRAFRIRGVPAEDEDGFVSPSRVRYFGSFRETGQRPYGAPSVFNFFRPDFSQTGPITSGGYVSPEFQNLTENYITATTNRLFLSAYISDLDNPPDNFDALWDTGPIQLNFSEEKAIAADATALVDRLNLLLLGGQMSAAMENTLVAHLENIPPDSAELIAVRVYEAVYLTASSPAFAVQR